MSSSSKLLLLLWEFLFFFAGTWLGVLGSCIGSHFWSSIDSNVGEFLGKLGVIEEPKEKIGLAGI